MANGETQRKESCLNFQTHHYTQTKNYWHFGVHSFSALNTDLYKYFFF